MMNIDEKTKCFGMAFKIARKGRSLTKEHIEVFKKLRGFLDDDTVDKIDSFKPGNKGILLVGDDFDLLSGTVSYIWYRHKLQYLMSGDKIIREGNIQLTTPHLIDNDFRGYNNEEEIRTSLFAQPDGLINKHKLGTVLFLRDVNTKYTEILERIGRAVRDFKFYRILETEPLLYTTYRDSKKFLYRVSAPSIVVMNAKQTERLPEEFLQQFEIIDLKTGSGKKEINQTTKNKNVKGAKGKDNFADVKIKMIVDWKGNYGNSHYEVSVTCNNPLNDEFKLQFRFMPVLYLLVKGVKKDTLYVPNKELKKARGDLDDAKKEIIKAFTRVIGQRAKKIIKIETGVGKKLMIPNKNISLKTNEPAFKEKV